MKRYLIITADDFGFSSERNKGVMEALNNNAITSASILLNCTATDEAIRMAKASSVCPGLHLNLTEGIPVSSNRCGTLTDDSGEMWGKLKLREKLGAGKVDADEIRCEIHAQITRFKELFGKLPVYVDGHQHIHLYPAVAEIFVDVLACEDIRITRYPIEVGVGSKEFTFPKSKQFLLDMMAKTKPAKNILNAHNIRTTDAFVGLSTMGADMTLGRLQSVILNAFQAVEKNGTHFSRDSISCELMCHPGYPTSEKHGGFSWGSDDFGCSTEREHELEILSSEEMFYFYAKNGIELVSHEKLLEL